MDAAGFQTIKTKPFVLTVGETRTLDVSLELATVDSKVEVQAVADALAAGSAWIHLGVFEENAVARKLYATLGFEPVGTYRRIGWKHGAWHDVAWAQRELGEGTDPPAETS